MWDSIFLKHARGAGKEKTWKHMEGAYVDLGLVWSRLSLLIVPSIICSSIITIKGLKVKRIHRDLRNTAFQALIRLLVSVFCPELKNSGNSGNCHRLKPSLELFPFQEMARRTCQVYFQLPWKLKRDNPVSRAQVKGQVYSRSDRPWSRQKLFGEEPNY